MKYFIVIFSLLAGCATQTRDNELISAPRIARITYVGSITDYASQHLCPKDSVYTVFEDVITHERFWRCTFPFAPVGSIVSIR